MVKYPIPTGYLFVDDYSKGKLETLSIGDYGKEYNVKADFLGYKKDVMGVPNVECMPLSEKWVVTLSTQYGCVMKCKFCDVPNVKMRGNASFNDLGRQLDSALGLFDVSYTERLNIHFARMGEPIFNENVFDFSIWLYDNKSDLPLRVEVLHPVLTTSLPKAFKKLEERILRWCGIKNQVYNGQAGLQFSINTTDEQARSYMFTDMQLNLKDFSKIAAKMPDPVSRKYCLNFAYDPKYGVDAKLLSSMFDSDKFMCKVTPIHNNDACRDAGMNTPGGYDSWTPYKDVYDGLGEYFDVLAFVPSMDEEEGLVTCGNLVLGGGKLQSNDVIKIKGL